MVYSTGMFIVIPGFQILAMLLCLVQMHVTFPVVKVFIALILSNIGDLTV